MGTKMIKEMSKKWLVYLLIILGSIIWSLVMFRSGIVKSYGMGFWGANGHDGVWHISLIESLARGSLANPVFSGSPLMNYHIGFDLLVAVLNRLTSISVSNLYFQILPPVFAVLIGFLTYKLVLIWRKSASEAFWSVVFVYLSSSFGFIVTFIRDRSITGESMFWSSQSISTLVNPPFALSLILILSGMIAYNKNNLLLSILCFGILIQIKAYAAVLILGGLFVSGVYSLFIQKNAFTLKVFLGSLVINLLLFFAIKNDGSSVFIWQPFWFLETLMTYSDRLNWPRYYSAMTTYRMGHLWFKGLLAYGLAAIIFLIGNLGIRIIGSYFIIKIIQRKEKISEIVVFIFSILFSAFIIPMLFVQKGTPWNTIQFFYYFLFFFAILAGISTSLILSKVSLVFKYLLLTTIIIFSILGVHVTLQHYLPPMPQSMISTYELEALSFLRNEPKGVVFTYPYNAIRAREALVNPPRPLYLYDSTAYVSAYTDKDVFLEDQVNLNIMGYDWGKRANDSLWFLRNLDASEGKRFLKENNIQYLYLIRSVPLMFGEDLKIGPGDLDLVRIFENKEVTIFSAK